MLTIKRKQFTIEEYHRLIELEFFPNISLVLEPFFM